MAGIDEADGLTGVWRGREGILGPLSPRLDGAPLPAGTDLVVGGGGWRRSIPLPGGARWTEEGFLPDAVAAVVITWSLDTALPGGGVGDETRPEGSGNVLELPVPPVGDDGQVEGGGEEAPGLRVELSAGDPVSVAILPPGAHPDRARSLLRPLAARRYARRDRSRLRPQLSLEVGTGEEGLRPLTAAIRVLCDAPLGPPSPEGDPVPNLDRFHEGGPEFLTGAHLAEFGIGALFGGAPELALAALAELVRDGEVPSTPVPFLHLVSAYALHTGECAPLSAFRTAIGRALEQLAGEQGTLPPPAAFPPPPLLLERLETARERGGNAFPVDRIRSLREAVPDRTGARRLPVLSGTEGAAPDDPVASGATPPVLPPPEAFGEAGWGRAIPARSVTAARIVRAWAEGILGIHPEIPFGRLRLSPHLRRGWDRLEARGILAPASLVSLDYRREGSRHSFVLRQEAGRVPIQLVFEPVLPVREIFEVRIGGEPAGVQFIPERDGLRIRCQFPLDPERSMTIHAEP